MGEALHDEAAGKRMFFLKSKREERLLWRGHGIVCGNMCYMCDILLFFLK